MTKWKNMDTKRLREQFAERIGQLIGDKNNPENLQDFHKITGRPISKLIQWRSIEHINWPDMKSLLYICESADISPTWLLFGKGPRSMTDSARPLRKADPLAGVLENGIEQGRQKRVAGTVAAIDRTGTRRIKK